MISYEPLRQTIKERGVTHNLFFEAGLNPFSTISQKKDINTDTLNEICKLLHCKISDVIKYKKNNCDDDCWINIDWETLEKYIKQSCMSFKSISLKLGKSQNWLNEKRRRSYRIRKKELQLICDFMEVSVKEVSHD